MMKEFTVQARQEAACQLLTFNHTDGQSSH